MKITKKDMLWNYLATFLKISSSILLLPLILRKLSSEDVGIWSIFTSVTGLVLLIDFGFHSSFSMNVTYVFSGVDSLLSSGHNKVNESSENKQINIRLLKGLIDTMRWFYSRVSIFLLFILLTVGTIYIRYILGNYHGDKPLIYEAWCLFVCVNVYNLYTLYYDALLEGKGLIKISKQIIIVGHITYLCISIITILLGYGLVGLVLAQLISIITIRVISNRYFFSKQISSQLASCKGVDRNELIRLIFPNATKTGMTSLGRFMIQKSAVIIGSLYLPLASIATFSITKQMIEIDLALAHISITTFTPQISNLRIMGNFERIRNICIKGIVISNIIFVAGAIALIFIGVPVMHIIRSNTTLNQAIIVLVAVSGFIGLNYSLATTIISTKNYIPFSKPSVFSGLATVLLIIIFLKFTSLGLIGMAIAPGIIDLCYQGWKWPMELIRELDIKLSDFYSYLRFRAPKHTVSTNHNLTQIITK